MDHTHSHEEEVRTYYMEQLCMIGIAGALGGIAIMLYLRGLLWFLAERFQLMVAIGGGALLALVAFRAVVVWVLAGKKHAVHDHDHDHDHGHGGEEPHHAEEHIQAAPSPHITTHRPWEEHVQPTAALGVTVHDHGHGHGIEHDHGHGHEHGHVHTWAPWRYVVLLLPVVLYFLGLPSEGFQVMAGGIEIEGGVKRVADTGVDFNVTFQELERAPYTAESRKYYEGKTVRLVGQYAAMANDRMFTLVRYKMNCCAADAVPLNAVIMLDPESEDKLPADLHGKWVEVTGQVQFLPRKDRPGVYVTTLLLRPSAETPLLGAEGALVKKLDRPPANPFL